MTAKEKAIEILDYFCGSELKLTGVMMIHYAKRISISFIDLMIEESVDVQYWKEVKHELIKL